MIDVTIENYDKVKKALKGSQKTINNIMARSVNRAAVNARSNMSIKVREKYIIKAADVKSTVSFTKATSEKPYSLVKSAGKKIPLTKFKLSPVEPRPSSPPKKGYKVQVLKGGGSKAVPRGFLVNIRGSLAFMQRDGTSRLPITRLMGPSVPEMIGQKSTIEWVESEAAKMLNKRLGEELEYTLGARKK